MVTIRTREGLCIHKKGLDHQGLKTLVEKLKGYKSDYTMLQGSVVIPSSYRKIRNIVSRIEEHHFEVLKIKHADRKIESMYLPMKDDARVDFYNEIVPGTSITANMLSYLMFNSFQMSAPAYREVKNRLSDIDWNTSPWNLLNWPVKVPCS